MLELFQWGQTSWLPPTLREETAIDVSPEGLYTSGQEVLRLTAAGLSQRQIARSLHLSHGVVGKYQAAAQRAGLSWPLPEALDDVTLAKRLCTKERPSVPLNPFP